MHRISDFRFVWRGLRATGVAAMFLVAALVAAQEFPTIRVPVRLVTVPTLVFSREGRLIPGLDEGDFHLFDNGHRQHLHLEPAYAPVSAAIVVQANLDVREYLPFIARTGSVIESLLLGETGEGAVVSYQDEIAVLKPFDSGDVRLGLQHVTARGRESKAIDAALRAVDLLKARPASRMRVLLLIGQPVDRGSQSKLAVLEEAVEKNDILVDALSLPELGKSFVSDTFSLKGLSSRTERGGYEVETDLLKLMTALGASGGSAVRTDPFSTLTDATGGTQLHFRKQKELENALAAIGVELRSSYELSYTPDPADPGYHTIRLEVAVPGAKAFARPGYWLGSK